MSMEEPCTGISGKEPISSPQDFCRLLIELFYMFTELSEKGISPPFSAEQENLLIELTD